jgi:histidyl-tRNA synthetase
LALEAQAERAGRSEVVPGETPPPSTLMLPFRVDSNAVLGIVKELRDVGHNIELDLRGKNIGKSLDWASKNGFTNVVIVGPQDFENSQCSVKNLVSGDQNVVALDSGSISEVL